MGLRTTCPTLIAVALLAAGAGACYEDDSSGPGNRRPVAKVLLTDAPFPFDTVESVNVYIVSVAASVTADTSEPGGQEWITITEPKQRVDLLQLQQGATTLVGEGELDADQYRAVRVIIDTDSSNITFVGGTEATVHWGSAGLQSIHAFVEAALAMPEEGIAEIVIDFDVGRSFHWNDLGDNSFNFLPWIRAVNKAATGSIAGTVLGDSTPLENATVTAYGASEDTWQIRSTGTTDAGGFYRLAYLLPGNYIVQIDPPAASGLASSLDSSVAVTVGLETDHDVNLGDFTGSLHIAGGSSMALGDTNQLEAFVVDSEGQPVADPAVVWTALDAAVAVDDSGRMGRYAWVRSHALGSGRVTATSGDFSDTLTIHVYADTSGMSARPRAPITRVQRRR